MPLARFEERMVSWKYIMCFFGHGSVKGTGAGQTGRTSGLNRCSFRMQAGRLHGWLVTHVTGMGLLRSYNLVLSMMLK